MPTLCPKTLEDLDIPDNFKLTEDGEDFLLLDSKEGVGRVYTSWMLDLLLILLNFKNGNILVFRI